MDFQTFVSEVDGDFKNARRSWDMQYVQKVGTLIPSGFILYVGPVNEAQVFAQWNDVYEFTYETKSGLVSYCRTQDHKRSRYVPCCL